MNISLVWAKALRTTKAFLARCCSCLVWRREPGRVSTHMSCRETHQRGFLACSCSACHSLSSAAPVTPPTVELLLACSDRAARQGAPSGL